MSKAKAIKLSKKHCEIIKEAESKAWIQALEKCLKYNFEQPIRSTFRQVTLENGVNILQEKNAFHFNQWYDICDTFANCNIEYVSIDYLESEMKFYGLDFWLERFIRTYENAITGKNKSQAYLITKEFCQ